MPPLAGRQFGYDRAGAINADGGIGRAGLGRVVVERDVVVIVSNVLHAVVHAVQTEAEEVAPSIMRGIGLHPERDREAAIRIAAEGRGTVTEPEGRRRGLSERITGAERSARDKTERIGAVLLERRLQRARALVHARIDKRAVHDLVEVIVVQERARVRRHRTCRDCRRRDDGFPCMFSHVVVFLSVSG